MKLRVCKDALVIPEQHRLGGRHTFARFLGGQIFLVELDAIDLFTLEQVGLTRILDLHLLQHLAHDHFDVLVIDGDALQSVHVLDFVDQVVGEFLHALDRQDVVRSRVPVVDEVTLSRCGPRVAPQGSCRAGSDTPRARRSHHPV